MTSASGGESRRAASAAEADLSAELRTCEDASRNAADRLIELGEADLAACTAALDCADICHAAQAVYSRRPRGRQETVYAICVAVVQAAGSCAELCQRYARGDDIIARCIAACQRTEHAAGRALGPSSPPPTVR